MKTITLCDVVRSLIYALIGALIMLFVLVGIGITQPRGTSVAFWCFLYVSISVGFGAFVVLALIFQNPILLEVLLGASAGATTGLGIHSAHHILEERKTSKPSQFDIELQKGSLN